MSEGAVRIFAAFNPDANVLLRLISRNIDDEMLQMIARQDPVGRHVDEHLRELRKIRDDGIIARPMHWQPMEVLERATSYVPDVAAGRCQGRRGHWACAFAAAALLRAYGDEETQAMFTGAYYPRLIQLLESLRMLDAGLEDAGVSSLAWLNLRLMGYYLAGYEQVFIGLGILALGTASKTEAFEMPLVATARWLMDDEKRAFLERRESHQGDADHWLLRAHDPLKPERWVALGRQLAQSERHGPAGDAARAIGRRLSGEIRMTDDGRDDFPFVS